MQNGEIFVFIREVKNGILRNMFYVLSSMDEQDSSLLLFTSFQYCYSFLHFNAFYPYANSACDVQENAF